ncbi:hypothetical protein HK098_001493 [Nowakowskiella sp. JEL0407]|nr:hypothetical protein HK098_001493 [Nowakowskiella sp. JEL0407]
MTNISPQLPFEIWCYIVSNFVVDHLRALSGTCRTLHSVCNDPEVKAIRLGRYYGGMQFALVRAFWDFGIAHNNNNKVNNFLDSTVSILDTERLVLQDDHPLNFFQNQDGEHDNFIASFCQKPKAVKSGGVGSLDNLLDYDDFTGVLSDEERVRLCEQHWMYDSEKRNWQETTIRTSPPKFPYAYKMSLHERKTQLSGEIVKFLLAHGAILPRILLRKLYEIGRWRFALHTTRCPDTKSNSSKFNQILQSSLLIKPRKSANKIEVDKINRDVMRRLSQLGPFGRATNQLVIESGPSSRRRKQSNDDHIFECDSCEDGPFLTRFLSMVHVAFSHARRVWGFKALDMILPTTEDDDDREIFNGLVESARSQLNQLRAMVFSNHFEFIAEDFDDNFDLRTIPDLLRKVLLLPMANISPVVETRQRNVRRWMEITESLNAIRRDLRRVVFDLQFFPMHSEKQIKYDTAALVAQIDWEAARMLSARMGLDLNLVEEQALLPFIRQYEWRASNPVELYRLLCVANIPVSLEVACKLLSRVASPNVIGILKHVLPREHLEKIGILAIRNVFSPLPDKTLYFEQILENLRREFGFNDEIIGTALLTSHGRKVYYNSSNSKLSPSPNSDAFNLYLNQALVRGKPQFTFWETAFTRTFLSADVQSTSRIYKSILREYGPDHPFTKACFLDILRMPNNVMNHATQLRNHFMCVERSVSPIETREVSTRNATSSSVVCITAIDPTVTYPLPETDLAKIFGMKCFSSHCLIVATRAWMADSVKRMNQIVFHGIQENVATIEKTIANGILMSLESNDSPTINTPKTPVGSFEIKGPHLCETHRGLVIKRVRSRWANLLNKEILLSEDWRKLVRMRSLGFGNCDYKAKVVTVAGEQFSYNVARFIINTVRLIRILEHLPLRSTPEKSVYRKMMDSSRATVDSFKKKSGIAKAKGRANREVEQNFSASQRMMEIFEEYRERLEENAVNKELMEDILSVIKLNEQCSCGECLFATIHRNALCECSCEGDGGTRLTGAEGIVTEDVNDLKQKQYNLDPYCGKELDEFEIKLKQQRQRIQNQKQNRRKPYFVRETGDSSPTSSGFPGDVRNSWKNKASELNFKMNYKIPENTSDTPQYEESIPGTPTDYSSLFEFSDLSINESVESYAGPNLSENVKGKGKEPIHRSSKYKMKAKIPNDRLGPSLFKWARKPIFRWEPYDH